jgi:hypothetical protein
MPRDTDYGQPGVAAPVGGETRAFVPASQLLTSESHSASPVVADVAYVAFLGIFAVWLVLLAICHRGVAEEGDPADDPALGTALPRTARRRLA